MKEPSELYTVSDVDKLILQIDRHSPEDLQTKAESREWTLEERSAEPKLDAMLKALERRVELLSEIKSGIRGTDGMLNVRV